jgi:hypothetical protein
MGKDKKQKEKRQIPLDQLPLEKRLHVTVYNADDCNAAIHGERVPATLGLEVSRLYAIHGIRHHHVFAQDLCGVILEFTRALNARDIMSGIIPETNEPEDIPYCIWHPNVPSQETLRTLIQRYPHLVYHAARACAIAGYVDLYKELDVLPEVHVVEEASYASAERKNEDSKAIYQLIVSQHVKFAVFNDSMTTTEQWTFLTPALHHAMATPQFAQALRLDRHTESLAKVIMSPSFPMSNRTILLTTSISGRIRVSMTTIVMRPHRQGIIFRFCMGRCPSTFRQWIRKSSF